MVISYREAVEDSKRRFRIYQPPDAALDGPYSSFTDGGLKRTEDMMRGLRALRDDTDAFLEGARSDRALFDQAMAAIRAKQEHGEALTAHEIQWLVALSSGDFSKPLGRPGAPNRRHYFLRLAVIRQVARLKAEGMDVMRTDNPKRTARESACDAVAEALGLLGLKPKKYSAVKGIWTDRQSILAEAESRVGWQLN